MPHRGIHHQGGGQPLIVPCKCTNAAAQFIPGLGMPSDALPNQKFEGEHPGMQLVRPELVLFVEQALVPDIVHVGNPDQRVMLQGAVHNVKTTK